MNNAQFWNRLTSETVQDEFGYMRFNIPNQVDLAFTLGTDPRTGTGVEGEGYAQRMWLAREFRHRTQFGLVLLNFVLETMNINGLSYCATDLDSTTDDIRRTREFVLRNDFVFVGNVMNGGERYRRDLSLPMTWFK